jgi:hypothetical protein
VRHKFVGEAASRTVGNLIVMLAPTFTRGRGSWLRTVLGLGVAVVALSVLGMHQLSLDHTFVAPDAEAGARPLSTLMGGSDTSMSSQRAVFGLQAPTVGHDHESNHGPQPCLTGCDDHPVLVTCLLALTLLIVAWRLRAPTLRDLPPFSALRLPVRIPLAGWPPALTLAELSVRRTRSSRVTTHQDRSTPRAPVLKHAN